MTGNRGGKNSIGSMVDNSDRLTDRSNNNSTNANNNNNNNNNPPNKSTTTPTPSSFPPAPTHHHFLILSYTRILLYTITPDHTITLTHSFTTDFIIPYNILLLQPPNPNTDDFVLALTGVDRRQTFWSGYWEI
jgi:hypothetical protein